VDEEQVTRRGLGTSGKSRGSFSISVRSARFSITRLSSSCSGSSSAGSPSRASLFQTGWFVESLMTQTLIIHVIRTNKIPSCRAERVVADGYDLVCHGLWDVAAVSPIASALGFTHLPQLYWPILMLTLLSYVALPRSSKYGCCESNGSSGYSPATPVRPAFVDWNQTWRPEQAFGWIKFALWKAGSRCANTHASELLTITRSMRPQENASKQQGTASHRTHRLASAAVLARTMASFQHRVG